MWPDWSVHGSDVQRNPWEKILLKPTVSFHPLDGGFRMVGVIFCFRCFFVPWKMCRVIQTKNKKIIWNPKKKKKTHLKRKIIFQTSILVVQNVNFQGM